jgi:LPXTG-site transpeptidase (sortase) family protein
MLLGWPLLFLALSFLPAFTAPVQANEPAKTLPTQLTIPAIDLNSTIVAVGLRHVTINGQTYGQWSVDDNLVGWHDLSAQPGQVGNTVLNGHSNVHAQVFRRLPEVEVGDNILLTSGDHHYQYRVSQKILVKEKGVSLQERIKNAQLINPTSDERITLITCVGPKAAYRLIVIAFPVTP